MPSYRRPRIPGATIFFTVALAERGSDLPVREIGLLREAVRATRAERPFAIDALVVLPDHLHCVATLPEGDRDFSTRRGPTNRIRLIQGDRSVHLRDRWNRGPGQLAAAARPA